MKKQVLLTLTLIFCTTFLTLNAQNWNEIINTTASDAGPSDRYGYSVAIAGDYAIVGANQDDGGGGSASGSAYVFVRSGNSWIEQAKLTASDAGLGDRFGSSVAIDGDYAIVGAYLDDDNGSASGSAYVFVRSGSSWTEQAKLTASDAAANDYFGHSVAIAGDYVIVGAYQDDDGGSRSGSAYVFVRSGNSWTEQVKLTASDAAANDYFGYSVAIAGDYVIVGAYRDYDGGSASGSAYVFVRSGNSWIEQAKLTPSDAATNDYFGYSVAIDGNSAIVGAYGNGDNGFSSGSAYVFMRSSNSWSEQSKLTASDAAANDYFGHSVAIAGDYALVGAYLDDDDGVNSGSAYVFVRSGNSWTEQVKLTASDASAEDVFGSSVAIDGDYTIVSAPFNDDDGSYSGSAYFFKNVPILPDFENLPDITAECEATPTAPTANSGAITATADIAFPIITQGTTIVTWTYDDGNGNTLTQTQNVIIDDTTAPNMSFSNPSDAIVDSCSTEVIVPSPLAIEDCITNDFALDFDGVDDIVTVNQTIGSFKTIEFWMYTENGINGSEEFDYLFSFNDSNLKYIGTGDFSVSYTNETLSMVTNFGQILTTFEVIPPGWNHIAITGNGSSFDQIVINGDSKPVVNNGFPAVFQATTTYIGQNPAAGASRFEGKLDEIRFWDTPRTEQDIADNFEKLIDTSSPNLLAYYNFENGTGSGALSDVSGNSNHGVLTNMDVNTDWVSSTAPVASVTLTNDFNGTSDASGTYPEGQTTVTWTASDANGNQSTLEQIVNIDCSITYTFNDGVWSPSDPGGVATVDDDIVIASGNAVINTNTSCDSVTVNPGAGLIVNSGVTLTTTNTLLESNSTSYSSLILDGTIAGNLSYERHININGAGTTGSNDLVSPPLTGQDFATFAAANPNILNNGAVYLFGPLEKVTGQYVNWTSTETTTLDAGVGYRTGTTNNGSVTFTGTANNGTVTNNIVNAGTNNEEWNLVGNPYPSYLNVQDFLSQDVGGITNIQLFDVPTAAIYGYDGSALNGWTIYNLANTTASTLIAPGQGFMVSADATNDDLYDLQFTPTMRRTGSGDDFILGRNAELIYMKLNASTVSNTCNTEFYFNANATQGFDLGYDAAVWNLIPSNFEIYSHLVENNIGKPIALQTLNATDLTEVSIPLGVNANQGEQITFSITETTLPASVNVYLDDVVANTTTLLNNSDYIITPSTNLSGTGRFFLRTSDDALSTIDNNQDTLNIFALNSSKEVVVTGQLQNTTTLELYDIQGRKVLATPLDNSVLENRIDVSSLSGGVYVVNIKNNTQQKTQKVIIK